MEKNVEKIVAITLSFGLVTMNAGSVPRKVSKPVYSPVSANTNVVINNTTVANDCLGLDDVSDEIYKDIRNSSVNTREKTVILDKKNTGIIRAPEIDLSSIVADFKCETVDTVCDDEDICILDSLEEDIEPVEDEVDTNILGQDIREKCCNITDEIVEPRLEFSENENREDLDYNLEYHIETDLDGLDNVEGAKKTDDSDYSEIQLPTEQAKVDTKTMDLDIQEDYEVVKEELVEPEQTTVVEPKETVDNDLVEDLIIENIPDIVVTPFGTRVIVEENKKNIGTINDNENVSEVENNNTDLLVNSIPEEQNTQIINSPINSAYPNIYKTLDDIPEEGINGVPKSTISDLVAVGLPLITILLIIGGLGYTVSSTN